MRRVDFGLMRQLQGSPNNYFQLLLERMQQFSIDSEISLDKVFKLPYYLIDAYYSSKAWKLKKEEKKKNVQMYIDILKTVRK